MTGWSCESEAAALVWCCWTDVSACSALSNSLQFKREHTQCTLPPFRCQLSSPSSLFSLLFCLLQPTSTSFPCLFLYLLYAARYAQIAVSLFTPTCQLSPLPWRRTIVMATQTGWGGWGEAEQDRTQRNMKERDRQRVEKVGSLFSLNDKEGTRLLINVPLPVY